jgi:hypothetical protein
VLVASVLVAQGPVPERDPIVRAMVDELDRARVLKLLDLDKPYHVAYSLEDADIYTASASLGALIAANRNRARIPQVQVRVGSYEFDNTNHVHSTYSSGARYDPAQWPLDADYSTLRQCFWLATDRAYKNALEALARKRGSVKNAADPDLLPDFSKATPVRNLQPAKLGAFDERQWTSRIVKLSNLFLRYPELHASDVAAQAFHGIAYFANSEGTRGRTSENLYQILGRARLQSDDGMLLRDAVTFPALEANGIPADAEIERALAELGENVRALAKAPIGDAYSGPVLFEGSAAGQLLAQLLGDNLRVPRRPVSDPGRNVPFLASEFETRLGSRVMPEWIDVVDDATQTEWRGRRLLGHYPFDMEGVPPVPVLAVEKGVLKSFITTRTPTRNASESNGHARLGGNFGTRSAAISNLFVKASETKPAAQLKVDLIEMLKQRGKPYGMIVRKLDYPSSASVGELRQTIGEMAQSGSSRPVSPPILVFRVYPDGREELVRGMRFRGLSTRALRDILAASEETYVFDFINNAAPFAMMGAGGFLAPTTVVAPAILFEDIELDRVRDEFSKPPIVPPPPIETAGS